MLSWACATVAPVSSVTTPVRVPFCASTAVSITNESTSATAAEATCRNRMETSTVRVYEMFPEGLRRTYKANRAGETIFSALATLSLSRHDRTP